MVLIPKLKEEWKGEAIPISIKGIPIGNNRELVEVTIRLIVEL